MTPHEERKIALWNRDLTGDVPLKVFLTPDPRSKELRSFGTELSIFAPRVQLGKEESADASMPFIEIRGNLRYSAVPLGLELDPFLQALSVSSGSEILFMPVALKEKLSHIDRPVRIKLYVAQGCPTCPAVVRNLVLLPLQNPHVHLHVIDAGLFPEAAEADSVLGVPTIILENGLRWSGAIRLEEIVEALASRDRSGLSTPAVERMLQEGHASRVAQMIMANGAIPREFIDLLTEERFTVRLGAMAAMEEIIQQNHPLAATITKPLWERFERVTEPVQIDILYLLGETGSRETIPTLESVLNGRHREHVKEVARESVERIRERTGESG